MPMNIRLQKYKKNRILGMNKYNSAIAAGFSESTAKVHTKQLEVRAGIEDVLERQGLTDKVMVKRLIELAEAKDFVEIPGVEYDVEKGRPWKPNWAARAKGIELMLKLKGHLKENPVIDLSKHTHLTHIYLPKQETENSPDGLEAATSPRVIS